MKKKIIIVKITVFILSLMTLTVLINMGVSNPNAVKAFRAKTNKFIPSDEFDTNVKTNIGTVDVIYPYNMCEKGVGKVNIECLFYNELDFMNIKDYKFDKNVETIRGLIVPHHLLAKDLIHEAFQTVVKNLENQETTSTDKIGNISKYKTVVIFGPDHESTNRGKVFTSSSNWQSPKGILNADKDIIGKISELDFVIENDEKMTVEHSISGFVPFIKYYFSDAKIVPLALTKQLTLENLNSLLYLLVENLDIETTLFISSVDFSHYLSLEEANKMDEVSIEAIINKDIEKIMKFTNDNMDSPNSIVAMLNTMELIEAEKVKIINKTNSQIILNKKIDETTSYVTFLFY